MRDRLLHMVELVTDLVFGSTTGLVSGKDSNGEKLDSSVGYHFGFYSRPKDGANGIVVKLGGWGNSSVLVAFRDSQYELTLEKGEVGIANAFDASVLLDQSGNVIATAKSGATFQANGSTYAMPQWDDFMTGLGVFLTNLTTMVNPNVSEVMTHATSFQTAIATASQYKSTKAKNG